MDAKHRQAYRSLGRLDYEFHGEPKIPPAYEEARSEYFKGFDNAKLWVTRFRGKDLRSAVQADKANGKAHRVESLTPRSHKRKTVDTDW